METKDCIVRKGKIVATIELNPLEIELKLFPEEIKDIVLMSGGGAHRQSNYSWLSPEQLMDSDELYRIVKGQEFSTKIATLSNWLTHGIIERDTFFDADIISAMTYASNRDLSLTETLIRLFLYRTGFPTFQQNVEITTASGYSETLPFYLKMGERRIAIQAIDFEDRHELDGLGIEFIYVNWHVDMFDEHLYDLLTACQVPKVARPISKKLYDALEYPRPNMWKNRREWQLFEEMSAARERGDYQVDPKRRVTKDDIERMYKQEVAHGQFDYLNGGVFPWLRGGAR
jgi:hypothetical protein